MIFDDYIEETKRLKIAIYQFSVVAEKTLVRLYEEDGNLFAGHILHKIYYKRSVKYRIIYNAHHFLTKIQRWLRMTRYP